MLVILHTYLNQLLYIKKTKLHCSASKFDWCFLLSIYLKNCKVYSLGLGISGLESPLCVVNLYQYWKHSVHSRSSYREGCPDHNLMSSLCVCLGFRQVVVFFSFTMICFQWLPIGALVVFAYFVNCCVTSFSSLATVVCFILEQGFF